RRRLGARGRRPGMPEQGPSVVDCSGRRPTTPRRIMTVSFQARVARDLVVVEGPDSTTFLQSLVSQDLDALEVGASGHSLLLQPQGKLLADFYIVHIEPETWWCVCEWGF